MGQPSPKLPRTRRAPLIPAPRAATRTALITIAVAGLVLLASILSPRRHIFPDPQWDRCEPAEAGFDRDRLAAFSERMGGCGCLVREGRLFHTWGEYTALNDIASAMKPLITHFTLKAVEEGLIPSLDREVADWVPELMDINPDLGFKDRKITFRHLLDQTSGYGLREPPGEAFAYNDFQTGLLLWTLIRRVYGCRYEEADQALLHDRLGRWLRFEDSPTLTHPNSILGRLRISARDLARFGYLYLRRGRWKDETVLSPGLVAEALVNSIPLRVPRTGGDEAQRTGKAPSLGGGADLKGHGGWLSWFWWVNRPNQDGEILFPDAPRGTFAATGYGGEIALVVVPEYNLVAVWINSLRGEAEELSPFDEIGRWHVNTAIGELLRSRRDRN